jgi:hypothetical protein
VKLWCKEPKRLTESAKLGQPNNAICNLEKRFGDLERHAGNSSMKCSNDVLQQRLCWAAVGSVYFKLEDDSAFIIILGGSYAVTSRLAQ